MNKHKKLTPNEVIARLAEFPAGRNTDLYLVGGFLRDTFLRLKSKDIDVVMESDALGFARDFSRRYGYQTPVFYGRFGTAMVEIDGIKLEFATCRKESYPEDSRKPHVSRATIYEDLERRDFTINAMARNLLTGEVLDPFHGRQAIKEKRVVTPIDPDKTFYDDPLRILRGVRFAARFGFEVDPATKEAMRRNVFRLEIVSEERIADEIMKMLTAFRPSAAFYLLDGIGVLDRILPEVSALKERGTDHPCKELFSHTLKVLDNICVHTKNVHLRLAALLHDIGKPRTLRVENGKISFHRHEFVGERMSFKICRRLKLGPGETQFVGFIIRHHLRPHLLAKEGPTDRGLRRFIREMGKDRKNLFIMARADLTSQNPVTVRKAAEKLTALEKRVIEINKRDKLSSFKLALDGHDIMGILSLKPGRAVGTVKDYLESLALDGALPNKTRALKKYVTERRDVIMREAEEMLKSKENAGENEETE